MQSISHRSHFQEAAIYQSGEIKDSWKELVRQDRDGASRLSGKENFLKGRCRKECVYEAQEIMYSHTCHRGEHHLKAH